MFTATLNVSALRKVWLMYMVEAPVFLFLRIEEDRCFFVYAEMTQVSSQGIMLAKRPKIWYLRYGKVAAAILGKGHPEEGSMSP